MCSPCSILQHDWVDERLEYGRKGMMIVRDVRKLCSQGLIQPYRRWHLHPIPRYTRIHRLVIWASSPTHAINTWNATLQILEFRKQHFYILTEFLPRGHTGQDVVTPVLNKVHRNPASSNCRITLSTLHGVNLNAAPEKWAGSDLDLRP